MILRSLERIVGTGQELHAEDGNRVERRCLPKRDGRGTHPVERRPE